MVCECERGGYWLCIDGEVYGPCEWEDCGGACEPEGKCPCVYHDILEGHDGVYWMTKGKEKVYHCPHDDAGEGDWCYLCWTNTKTGETYE